MDSNFTFGATAGHSAGINPGSRKLRADDIGEPMDRAALIAALGLGEPPRYERHLAIPTRRLQRWEWWVTVGVGGERETVVGPHRAWTKWAADRRAFRHYARLTEQAARLTREAARRDSI